MCYTWGPDVKSCFIESGRIFSPVIFEKNNSLFSWYPKLATTPALPGIYLEGQQSHCTWRELLNGWEGPLFCDEGIPCECQLMLQIVSAPWQLWQESLVYKGAVTCFSQEQSLGPEAQNESTNGFFSPGCGGQFFYHQ
jgi:hypothetical protein